MKVRQTAGFANWLGSLRDRRAQARIVARLARIELGLLGDVKRFDGLTELRVDYGPGYRIYAAQHGDIMIILLCGGDKNSQRRDIDKARAMLAQLE